VTSRSTPDPLSAQGSPYIEWQSLDLIVELALQHSQNPLPIEYLLQIPSVFAVVLRGHHPQRRNLLPIF
jgi:hypothetical protein